MTLPPAAAPPAAPTRRLFESALLRAGEFAIAPEAPGFADAGQMRRAEFVFPRRGVWIEHADAPPFVADPTLVTLYNAGEPYRRHRLDPQGDRCDWFAPAPQAVLDVVASVDPAIRERPERPFRFHSAPADARCVAAQRRLARRLRAPGGCDPLEVEETMFAILRRVVVAAYASDGARRVAPPPPPRRGLAGDVKAFVLPRAGERLSLDRIAGALGVSPFHLCRRFKAESGRTLHGWLLDVRLRLSLERVVEPGSDLAAVALDVGFASHSHFTAAFRRAFGCAPSELRRQAASAGARRLNAAARASGARRAAPPRAG